MMRVFIVGLFVAFGYSAEFKAKLEDADRSPDKSTGSGCEPIHGIVPDENCLYIIDDMIFTKEEILAAFDPDRNGINLANYKWPNNSQVYGQMAYEFDRNDIAVGSDEENFIQRVIQRFNIDLEGCLRIVPRTSESDYVNIKHPQGDKCTSAVGALPYSKSQNLNLGGSVGGSGGCYTDSVVVHEFIHAWGFTHEQNRPDRDSFVKINLQNVKPNKVRNFDIKTNYLTYGVHYNGLSVMHYSSNLFSKDTKLNTMESKKPDLFTTDQMGTNDWMTLGDVSKLRQMYGCDSGSCKNTQPNWHCENLASEGYCATHPTWMNEYCRSSCNFCNGFCEDTPQHASNCEGLAKEYGCFQEKAENLEHVIFMQEHCRKTCDLCPSNCKDNAEMVMKCSQYKEKGLCQGAPWGAVWGKMVQNNCRKTCNLCLGMHWMSGRSDEPLEIKLDNSDTNLPVFPEDQIPDERSI